MPGYSLTPERFGSRLNLQPGLPETVRAYSVTGDGQTDDYNALREVAVKFGTTGHIYFPAGTYRVGTNLTLNCLCEFAPGATFDPDSGVTVTLAGSVRTAPGSSIIAYGTTGTVSITGAVDTGANVYNVKAFGALGDNSTDDFDAVQAAVDAAVAAGGGIVYFPVGLYRVSQSITLGSNITIRGSGRENTTLRTLNYGSGATFTGSYVLKGTDVENIVIEDLEIRGVSLNGNSSSAIFLTLDNNDNTGHIIVRNVLVNDHAGDGIIINTPILCTFQNVKMRYCVGHGVKVFNGTSTNFYDCYAVTCLKAGFFLDTMVYCALVGCASDVCGVGYDLEDSSAISIIGSGCESARLLAGYEAWPGISYRTNGSRVAMYSCYSRDPDTAGQAGHFTGDFQVYNFRAMQGGVQTMYQLRLVGSSTETTQTIDGDIAFDTSTLFVDASANRVGVRTTSPTVPLDVGGDSSGTGVAIRARDADDIANIQFRNNAASVINGIVQAEKVGTNGGKISLQSKPDGGAIATRLEVPATASAGQVYLLVYDVDNATLEQVTVGAADSGGSGFKVLRIPN